MSATGSQILAALAECRQEYIDFTKKLVALRTENPPGRFYRACTDAIAEKISEIGLEYTLLEVPQKAPTPRGENYPRYCLLSEFGKGSRSLYFHGHYDVVPAQSKEQFEPYEKDGCIFGRGASDMKSGLATMIFAVKAIKMCNIALDGKINLTFVPDEETGGILGSQYLKKAGMLGRGGIGMLLPEPTSGVVWNANRGAVTLKIIVKGISAHVGHHYRGSNAFEKMLLVAERLLEIKHDIENRKTRCRIQPEDSAKAILLMGGLCHGGSGFNVVPEEIYFTVDRRINPEEDFEIEKARLLDCLDRLKKEGLNLDVEILQEGGSSMVSGNDSLSTALSRNIEEIVGQKPAFEMCPGLLEIRFYNEIGVPALSFGPGRLECSHGPEEYVEIKKIGDCAAIYALTAIDLLST